MGSTFSSLHCHVVFSTKERTPVLAPAIRQRLYPYLTAILKANDIKTHAVGGVEDHVHLLLGLRPSQCVAEVVRELKLASGGWLRGGLIPGFYWQEGYGAFSVGPKGIPKVAAYIADQEEHHRAVSFREELKRFLDEAGVPYEDRFLD